MEIDGAASQPGSSIAGLPATLISATAKVVFAFMDDNSATSNVVFAAITESDLPKHETTVNNEGHNESTMNCLNIKTKSSTDSGLHYHEDNAD